MRRWVTSLPLIVLASMASADGFDAHDLGDGGSPAQCLTRAHRTLVAYARQSGSTGAVINDGAWSSQAFGLQPGDVDVQIACPYRDNHVSVALMILHSAGPARDRAAMIDALVARWRAAAGPSVTK